MTRKKTVKLLDLKEIRIKRDVSNQASAEN
mgnify:CR=1 FL=1